MVVAYVHVMVLPSRSVTSKWKVVMTPWTVLTAVRVTVLSPGVKAGRV